MGQLGVIGISFPNGPAPAALSIMLPLVPASEVAVAEAEASKQASSSCSSCNSSNRFGPACRPQTPNSLTGGRDILPVHYVQQQHCGVEEREATKSGAHYTDMGTYLSTYPYHTVQSRLVLRQSIWPAGPPMWDVGSCLSRPHFCHSLTESLTATRG